MNTLKMRLYMLEHRSGSINVKMVSYTILNQKIKTQK